MKEEWAHRADGESGGIISHPADVVSRNGTAMRRACEAYSVESRKSKVRTRPSTRWIFVLKRKRMELVTYLFANAPWRLGCVSTESGLSSGLVWRSTGSGRSFAETKPPPNGSGGVKCGRSRGSREIRFSIIRQASAFFPFALFLRRSGRLPIQ